MAVLYSHTRLDKNEIFYVGIGANEKRAYSKRNRNIHWRRIVKNSDYSIQIIAENISWKDAIYGEKYLIQYYGRRHLKTGSLVNITEGGDGVTGLRHSDEAKQRISEANKGNRHTKESKKRIGLASKGSKNPFYGKKHTEAFKLKIGNFHRNRTPEMNNKISEAHTDETIYEFFNKKTLEKDRLTRQAFSDKYNILKDSICKVITGTRKSIYNWTINNISK